MSVHGSGIQALQVEQGNRRINQEAEHTGADHIPESHGHEAHQRPAQALHPRGGVLVGPVFMRFLTQQNQRHHFQSGEGSAHGHNRRGGTGKIQVVERAGHTADHKQRSGNQ